jgi:hypothetical protein
MAYSDEQIQLQSLVESELVAACDAQFARRIAYANPPSAKQAEWVTKLLQQTLGIPSTTTVTKVVFDKIFALMGRAKKAGLQAPKVLLKFGNEEIKMSVASDRAKHPGALSLVTDNRGYMGRINLDSSVTVIKRGVEVKQELLTLLTKFNEDPAKMAAEHGKLLSKCCFCSRQLSTPESKAMGYGPDCAEHYGLPWGKDKFDDLPVFDEKIAEAALADFTAMKNMKRANQ